MKLRTGFLLLFSCYYCGAKAGPDMTAIASPDRVAILRSDTAIPVNQTSPDAAGPVKPGSVRILPMPYKRMEPRYATKNSRRTDTLQLILKLTGKYDPSANQVRFAFSDTNLSNSPVILDSVITLTEEDWKGAVDSNKGVYNATLYINTATLSDTLDLSQRTFIVLEGQSTGQYGAREIKLSRGIYNPNKPFWVEFGANFDLLDGLQANNLYGGIFMHKKDAARIGRADNNNLSFFAGVYESKTATSEQPVNYSNFMYKDNNAVETPGRSNDSFTVIHRDTGTVVKNTSIQNLGLFFSPQLRLTNGPADADGVHLFLALWIEMVWQRVTSKYDYSGVAEFDTVHVSASQAVNYLHKPGTLKGDFRSHYFGVGLPFYMKEKSYNLYVNPVIGYSNQASLKKPGADSEFYDQFPFSFPWKFFYLIQFRLNEEKYGLAFTGEIRGTLAPNYKPFISLALSKKFDLSKLLEFK